MGLFDWLGSLFGSRPAARETPDDVADRVERFADRFGNAGDTEAERAARVAAAGARCAPDTRTARAIEHAFLQSRGLGPDGRPAKPVRGHLASGSEYVRYGNRARAGGSRGWRYNNPGYVRCSDRATRYGAIGCDGEYAIFPDERTGRYALAETLREAYPNRPLKEALHAHLPPEVNPGAVQEQLERSGLDPAAQVSSLTQAQLEAAAASIAKGATNEGTGQEFAPDTGGSAWDEISSAPATSGSSGSSDYDRPTDNS
ncbi:MAG: hypothetical protein ACKODX_02155 [Gemmata sp.]